MNEFPFTEKKIGDKLYLREFKENTLDKELIWHQDREDRTIKVLESNNWKLQLDNELPVILEVGSSYDIPAYLFHRVIKGKGKLVIELLKK